INLGRHGGDGGHGGAGAGAAAAAAALRALRLLPLLLQDGILQRLDPAAGPAGHPAVRPPGQGRGEHEDHPGADAARSSGTPWGCGRLPRQPYVVVSNHQSSLDLLGMMEVLPDRCVPIAKRELLYMGAVGVVCWLGGIIFIDPKENATHPSAAMAPEPQHTPCPARTCQALWAYGWLWGGYGVVMGCCGVIWGGYGVVMG
uniref:1-acylglycerol-3-phosphate O-acyltransferase n=1 Tax=Geospiza parvula TaxID=87175 RepID=A0A8U8B7J9_GEOPR